MTSGWLSKCLGTGHDTIPHYIKATVVISRSTGIGSRRSTSPWTTPHVSLNVEALKKVGHPDERDYPLGTTWAA